MSRRTCRSRASTTSRSLATWCPLCQPSGSRWPRWAPVPWRWPCSRAPRASAPSTCQPSSCFARAWWRRHPGDARLPRGSHDGAPPGCGCVMRQPLVTVLIPERWRERVLSAEAAAQLAALAEVRWPAGPDPLGEELPGLLGGRGVCLTGWGTPRLTEELLAGLPELKLVAHTAGSVRFLLPADVLKRGVRVSHAAAVMAEAVAEHVVAQALLSLQGLHVMDARMRGGEWDTIRESVSRHLLGGQVVGVWGAGRVGREVIRLLRAFRCAILVADPYLDLAAAESLGAELVSLEELFLRADVVSLHAPLLPETRGL